MRALSKQPEERFQSIAPGLKQFGSPFSAGNFDAESNPGGAPIIANAGRIESIANSSWVAYTGFNFGTEANFFSVEGATPGKGGTVEVRIDSEQGLLVGRVDIQHTGGWGHYRRFSSVLTQSISGVHSLYLRFVDSAGGGGDLFNVRSFTVSREVASALLPYAVDEDGDQVPKVLEHAFGMHPQSKDAVPLRMAVNDPVGGSGVHDIEIRLRSDKSLV